MVKSNRMLIFKLQKPNFNQFIDLTLIVTQHVLEILDKNVEEGLKTMFTRDQVIHEL